MNALLSELLESLRSRDEPRQKTAALKLAFLLQKQFYSTSDDSVEREVLSPNEIDAKIATNDFEQILVSLCGLLPSNEIVLDARISIVTALGKIPRAQCLTALIRFLSEKAR